MRNIFILLLLFSFVIIAKSQSQTDLKVALKTEKQSKPQKNLYFVNELNSYSPLSYFVYDSARAFLNISDSLCKVQIKYLDFQPEYSIYKYYLKKKRSLHSNFLKEEFIKNEYNLKDTANFYQTEFNHCVFFLSGFNKKGNFILIVDANNNLDFGDDTVFQLDTLMGLDKRLASTVNVEYCYNKVVYNKKIALSIIPFDPINAVIDSNKFSVSVYTQEYKHGNFTLANDTFDVDLRYSTSYLIDPIETWELNIIPHNQRKQKNAPITYRIKDTVQLNAKLFQISSVSRFADTVTFEYIKEGLKYNGFTIGDKALPIYGTNFINNKIINTVKYKDKYILLDFWGSWCTPCISSIPKLVSLSKKYKKRLEIISIANDNVDKLHLLKKMIKEKKMNWEHLIDPEISKNAYNKSYRITAYPTYILLDKNGKIIARVEGNNLDKIENCLF